MPRPITNNRINYQNIYSRIINHDEFLSQGVKEGDSPTFLNLTLTGNATIQGNLYVEGNTSLLDTNVVEFKDNIILINNQETSSGVTLNQAGLEIDRGSSENFRIVYNEINSRVEVGVVSNLQPIVIRESTPLNNGIMIWNSSTKRIESSSQINLPITMTSTVNSTSSTTGALIIGGGVGIEKDVFIDGKISLKGTTLSNSSTIYTNTTNNSLNITGVQDINITPVGKILIPFDKYFSFGNSDQSIIANSLTNALTITSNGDINLTPSTNKKINIPNQIPITFSTQNEKIYTDSSNNMIIAGSQDIILLPNSGNAGGRKIFIPVDTPIAFSNSNQTIIANVNNDLSINANNNIFLTPGSGLDVKLPIDAGIRFGSGYQRIFANSDNHLILNSNGDIYLSPQSGSKVNIPVSVPLTFSTNTQYIFGDSNGNLIISTLNQLVSKSEVYISNTINSTSGSSGSIHTDGGLGVKKDIVGESSIIVKSSNSNILQIQNTSRANLLNVNATNVGKVSILTGDGTNNNPSLEISSTNNTNAQSLIQLKANYDSNSGYMIGRGTSTYNDGRAMTFNIPSYTTYSNTGARPKFSIMSDNNTTELFSIASDTGDIYSLGQFGVMSTGDSTSPTTGALVVKGGLGVVNSIYTSGKIIHSVDSTEAYQLKDASSNVLFNNDTVTKTVNINEKTNINYIDSNAFTVSDTYNTLYNIDTNDKILSSSLQYALSNTNDSTDSSTGAVVVDGGMGIKKSLNVDGNSSFKNGINMLNSKITNLTNPTSAQDAATKEYVDLVRQGLYVKDSVNVATVSPQNLNSDFAAGQIIDGYTLIIGNRILIKDQVNKIENGIYKITNSTPVRTIDLPETYNASGIFVFVKSGTINASLGWICNSVSPQDIVGTSDINFTEFTGLGQVQAGNALSKNFNEMNVNVDDYSIEIEPTSDSLRIKSSNLGTGLTGGSGAPIETVTDQSHVTKLGTINTGVWQGSNIQVSYGGTGKTIFNQGNILFGNGTNPIGGDPNLYYDAANVRLGLGTNAPKKDFEIQSTNTITMLLNADSDANNANAKPEIKMTYNGGATASYFGMTRSVNQYASQIYSDALVISNDQTTTNSRIQLATNRIARFTILSNGNVGINNTNPNVKLFVNGTLTTTDISKFTATKPSTSATEGSVIITGGLSITCPTNSSDISNGGGLTVQGGVSIGKDLYVGGSINSVAASSNTFSYLTITATDEAINLTTGSLLTFGGLTIQCTSFASSVTDGGSLLTPGGASIGANLYVGNTIYAESDTYLGNLYFYSTADNNYIQPPDSDRNVNSFLPIHFTKYNNTGANTLTIYDKGIILNDTHTIQIGGTLQNPDGYSLQYITNNFNIIPNNTTSNYNINVGTIGNYSNLNIYGNNSGQIRWQSTQSNLLMTNSSIQLNKLNSTGSIVITTPDVSSESFVQASGGNMTLNLGTGSTGGQLITKLTNNVGDSSVTFTPSNISSSTLVLTNNVYSTFDGPTTFSDRVEYSGNALHQTIINTSSDPKWLFLGTLGEYGYCEIDFNNGTNVSSDSLCGLKFMASVSNTTGNASHLHYGDIVSNSNDKPICYMFTDYTTDYYIFAKLPAHSQTNINVTAQQNNKFLILDEGSAALPDGTFSGYTNSWTMVYNTQHESTLRYTTGDLIVEKTAKINDNLPIIGYNNENTNVSRDLGILYQRYQVANNSGTGDIVDDATPPQFIDSIPSQSLISNLSHVKLSNLSSSVDNYYTGWWIKVASGSNTNQVRQITDYNGAQRIATLDTPFTTQNPNTGASINFYKNSYVVNYYDEINDTFSLSYTNTKPVNGTVNNTGNANLRLKSLYSTDTTVSTNASSGSVRLLGGISINNTNDAQSSSYGGTITTAGGVGIRKDLRVGNNLGLGTSGFTTEETIHIRKPTATSRYEHDTSSYGYIDFVENGTSNRYGILFDSSINEFCLTNTNSGQTPNNSNKALTINNLGYVGINTTTNVVSPLAVNVNNFISTNSSKGYLGLVGGATNINSNTVGSRVILHANSQSTSVSQGCLNLYAGNVSTGNVSVFTGDDVERIRVDSAGQVTILSTHISDSNSTGSLITHGGVCIESTQNATSITSGGALSVSGGVAIKKDIYIGGNIYIEGSFTAAGSVTEPTIVFYDERNCSVVEYFSNNLSVSGSLATLTFGFSVTPSNDGENCEVEIELPGRTNAFIRRFEIISNCSGYTDETEVVPIMNILACGIVGTPRLLIKFQSVSTSIHYFQVSCTYILA